MFHLDLNKLYCNFLKIVGSRSIYDLLVQETTIATILNSGVTTLKLRHMISLYISI
jgi:hypothetical protein